MGTNTLLWGNDYPHGDSVFPHSQQVLNEMLQDCTPEERYEMTVQDVVQLYNLPFKVYAPSVSAILHDAPWREANDAACH